MNLNLAPILNAEILRVAKLEKKTNEKLMKPFLEELAELCGVGLRMIYHWRSGRNKLPAEYVSVLCARFGSNALLDELNRAAAGTEINVPDNFDLAMLASQSVREDLTCYEKFLNHFETDGIQPGEMIELRELGARIHGNVHRLLEIAEADCSRRLGAEAPPRKENVKVASPQSQIKDSRKRVAR